jgi:hypothetical protein
MGRNKEEAVVFMSKILRYLFGYDEYVGGEHIAHEPSCWQRYKAWREVRRNRSPIEIVIEVRYDLPD